MQLAGQRHIQAPHLYISISVLLEEVSKLRNKDAQAGFRVLSGLSLVCYWRF